MSSRISLILVLLFSVLKMNGQINLDFLFSPGLTSNSTVFSNANYHDSLQFNLHKHEIGFTLPLKTKINVGLKKLSLDGLKLNSSQVFFTAKLGLNQGSNIPEDDRVYKADLGMSGVYAGLNQGVWLYGINAYINESSKSISSPISNFRVYLTRVHVKRLDFIFFYGGAFIYHNGVAIPSPLLGFNRKWGKTRLSVTLPREVKLTYKSSKSLKVYGGSFLDGLNTIYRDGGISDENDNSFNYRTLKLGVGFEKKLGNFKVDVNGGYGVMNKLEGYRSDFSEPSSNNFYFAVSMNYQFGKSLFGQLFSF